ncbi:thiamine-phosphate kinase [Litchfieldia alkalitelluris]|uniref:thiamine-phosphate kinase n=1 Tax=Litchfieldia alkalitelluris TaxID=304268 RepID=UPI000998944C|nr:thiamine-phosphate kinase [Litchfieldia alkalitelluris]
MSIQDEFSFINRIRPTKIHQTSSLVTGIGDDAAVYLPTKDYAQIVCTDTLVEEIHFTKETMSPFQLGYKALAVNISDIAAMGGKPLYFLVSIAISNRWTEDELVEIYDGMNTLADTYKIDLIGGDTVSSRESLMITVTVIGETEKGQELLRSSAKDGDVVFVTGTVGDSSGGLELLLARGRHDSFTEHEQFLVKRHQIPSPRVEIGRLLTNLSRVSLNDVSDGVASEANELAEASNVTITLLAELLPISKALQTYDPTGFMEKALFGGEDFELIGTMSETDWKKVKLNGDTSLTKIGSVSSGEPKVLLSKDNSLITLEKKGYNHFKK